LRSLNVFFSKFKRNCLVVAETRCSGYGQYGNRRVVWPLDLARARPVDTGVILTPVSVGPWTRPVDTDSVYRALTSGRTDGHTRTHTADRLLYTTSEVMVSNHQFTPLSDS